MVGNSNTHGKIILIDGNISAGKSTLTRYLSEHYTNYISMFEPVDSNPYLAHFYSNPHKYCFPMQMWLLTTRFQYFIEAIKFTTKGKSVLLDRSIFSDFVFAKQGHESGLMNDEQFHYYMEVRKQMLDILPIPDILIYLDVKPQICWNRVHNVRKRDCENGIPVEYLEHLDIIYQDWLDDMSLMGIKVMKLDWNNYGSVYEVSDLLNSYLHVSNNCLMSSETESDAESETETESETEEIVLDEEIIEKLCSRGFVDPEIQQISFIERNSKELTAMALSN
eukprot:TRINITY_DN2503_c0_g2_i1.p1 TRINITY_DN2503_c0_g2~~TRINITY_DN2503_c0_g2_i1.p1  ORF type:complete len:279 (-),score=78.23 TRINITY_DN2503_c0_g2_i1:1199-2035(-)